MPSWGLASAQKLGAKYDFASKRLIIGAEGHVGHYSSGMRFDRIPVPGELLFQLGDWQMVGGPKLPYKHNQSFAVELPNRNFPSNQVTIETLSGFHTLQISDLPLVPQEGIHPTPQTHTTKKTSKLIKSAPIHEDLIIVHKKPFHICTTTYVKNHPSALLDISIKFDPNFFELQNTAAQYNPLTKCTTLTYTFTSIQTGTSQILINKLIQTLTPHLQTTTHNIDIDLPNHPTFIPSSKLRKLSSSPHPASLPLEPPSFLERVLKGFGIVKEKFPNAQLLEIDAMGVRPGPVEGVMGFVVLKLVASPGDGSDRTVVVGGTGWDDWEEVGVEEFVMWDLLPIALPENPLLKEDAVTSFEEMNERSSEMEEGVESEDCMACTGLDGSHSPDCFDGSEKNLENDKPQPTEPPQFSAPRTPNTKRERTKTTAHNFTLKTTLPLTPPKTPTSPKTPSFIDIQTAFNILTSAAPNTKPKPISCNLRHPMYPGFTEPYYVFTLQKPVLGSLYIGIGAVGGGVRVFGGGQGGAVRRLSDGGEGTVGGGVGERRRGSIGVS